MSAQATGTDPGAKSAAEIEREVEQSRAEVEHTLGAIQDRLSPGQLLDRAVGYFRGGSGDFARNLGDSIAANPVPVALVGLGLAWMMVSSQRSRRDELGMEAEYWDEDLDEIEEPYAGFAEADVGYVGPEAETGGGFGERLAGAAGAARSTIGERARHVGESVRHASERARHAAERARRAGEQARARFGRARAGIAERAHEAGARARHHGRRARRGVLRTLDEQPLVLGAIGLAIGAALGAALPPSETEDRLMGDARDAALRQATKAGREQAAKAREAASAVVAAAREEAGRQGLTPSSPGAEPGQSTAPGTERGLDRS